MLPAGHSVANVARWRHIGRPLASEEAAHNLCVDSVERTVLRVIAAALLLIGVWYFGSAEA